MTLIPKIIFQITEMKPHDNIIQFTKNKCTGWEYKHFTWEDIIKFIIYNPIPELQEYTKKILLEWETSSNNAGKEEFLIFYYLYLNGGVYINDNIVLNTNLDDIIQDYSFIGVTSALKNQTMFNGFIAISPKNSMIFDYLAKLHSSFYKSSGEYYDTILDYASIYTPSSKEKILILNEEFLNSTVGITKDKDENVLFYHYICGLTSAIPVVKKELKSVKKTKIGITFDLPKNIGELFANGIKQNVLYLGELFLNIGYDCYFILRHNNDAEKNPDLNKIFYDQRFKYIKYNDLYSYDLDVFIIMGYDVLLSVCKILKHFGTKIVRYFCGNSYLIDSESILYSMHKDRAFNYINSGTDACCDSLWSIPQMVNTNLHYYQTIYRTKCIEAPFVWSSKSIQLAATANSIPNTDQLLYVNRKNTNLTETKVGIFEPNLSLMKWCLPPILICENAYRKERKPDHVFICNVLDKPKEVFNIKLFNGLLSHLDLFKANKMSIEGRLNTLVFMHNFANIAVSHQLENPLNYLYLDLAWMGWPIIHNASLCKDIGYYYENFNYEQGSNMLLDVIANHDTNKDKYIKENRSKIDRYLPTNKKLQLHYKKLIKNLFTD
jgi:hypothetical protein